jgi:hypothetical protein
MTIEIVLSKGKKDWRDWKGVNLVKGMLYV